ncbi:hypothetical protein CC86DRAFT_410354 [Ophiobolus disseminans]|uniref:Uncharacterized protein n=1 Tax=Ophiobolus disseminans TaxID=1469910 RepID=A0A6A6ZLM5_9PLEO|nr:hypothetical protein CC86DRAFT_410354 [Ophiobolus disseminans]
MQHHRATPLRRTPPPDGVRNSSAVPSTHASPPPRSQPTPKFLIVGLFALRLAKRLIEGLERYPGRDDDTLWLADFVAPYPFEYALAKISGSRMDDYLTVYQDIVSRMKRQPRYPMRFMQINPDLSSMQQRTQGRTERERGREMTDLERLDIIDFCDAAAEWGSTVPIPAREADKMIELADQRRIANLDDRRPTRDDGQHYEERRW